MVDTELLWVVHKFYVLLEGFSTEVELFVCPGAGPQNLLNSEHKNFWFYVADDLLRLNCRLPSAVSTRLISLPGGSAGSVSAPVVALLRA